MMDGMEGTSLVGPVAKNAGWRTISPKSEQATEILPREIAMKRLKARYGCAVELSLEILGGKWKSVLLARLKDKPLRYGELRALVPKMSEKMLTQRLKDLEKAGLIAKLPGARPAYALTMRAKSLRAVLQGLYQWGETMAAVHGIQLVQGRSSSRSRAANGSRLRMNLS